MCKNKSHILMYICPLLKEVKIKKRIVEVIEITPLLGPSSLVLSQASHVYQHGVHSDNKFL